MSRQTKLTATQLTSTRFTAALERRVFQYARKHAAFAGCDRVVVAVSGGPDSTALLVLLARLHGNLLVDLTVAHFDHKLRTSVEAAADLDFVRSLASSLDLPFTHGSGDVRAHAKEHHLSLEDAARHLRYGFLRETALKCRASVVAVGHTLDDQAETVLLHLIRGSGLNGISGMSVSSPWRLRGADRKHLPGPTVLRPLLAFRRRDTERYCREVGLSPRQDPTNELSIAARNRIRREILPALRGLNPRVEEALARLSDAAHSDAGYLNELADMKFRQIASLDNRTVVFSHRELRVLPRPLAIRLIQRAYLEVHGTTADLEATHIETLLTVLHGPPSSHSLPAGVSAIIDSNSVIIAKQPLPAAASIPIAPLAVPGRTVAGRWRIEAFLEEPPTNPVSPTLIEAYLDADKAGPRLAVRSRRPGDRLRPLGLGGEKKLQDILVDAKVPGRERDGVPLVCAGEQIVWVVGHCIDERYALTPPSRRAVHLIVSRTTDT